MSFRNFIAKLISISTKAVHSLRFSSQKRRNPSAEKPNNDAYDPELGDLRECQAIANLYAIRFVDQECIFREGRFIWLVLLTDLSVSDWGVTAKFNVIDHEGFTPNSEEKEFKVSCSWVKSTVELMRKATLWGNPNCPWVIYADPDVVYEAKRVAIEHSDADMEKRRHVLGRLLNKADDKALGIPDEDNPLLDLSDR